MPTPNPSPWPPSQVSCRVEEAFLPHLLVVSVESPVLGPDGKRQKFQGALIEVTNALNEPFFAPPDYQSRLRQDAPGDYRDKDTFAAMLAQRHTYFAQGRSKSNVDGVPPVKKAPVAPKKLGVRLRARQVLCHNCKNVCNEKGENVQHRPKKTRRPVAENQARVEEGKRQAQNCSLVPKLRRLEQSEIERFSDRSSGEDSPVKNDDKNLLKSEPEHRVSPKTEHKPLRIRFAKLCDNQVDESFEPPKEIKKESVRNLRKKRSAVGSMEDLWDESIFEESEKRPEEQQRSVEESNKSKNSGTVLKICFGGTDGKGTIVKIPPSQNCDNSSEKSTKSPKVSTTNLMDKKKRDAKSKAAKKALKRAKKEAQIRARNGGVSPSYLAGRSPAYYRGGRSPAPVQSPIRNWSSPPIAFAHPGSFSPVRYGLSPAHSSSFVSSPARSPAYFVSNSSDQIGEKLVIKKHKRKKHKRKKSPDSSTSQGPNDLNSENANTSVPPPPFPHILVEEISGQTVDSCVMASGETLNEGNLVWGKANDDYPWWPGKVLNIYLNQDGEGEIQPEATVSWFCLSKISLFPCSKLRLYKKNFQECFSSFNKDHLYKEAVFFASNESKVENESLSPNFSPEYQPRPVNCAS